MRAPGILPQRLPDAREVRNGDCEVIVFGVINRHRVHKMHFGIQILHHDGHLQHCSFELARRQTVSQVGL